MPVSKVLIGDIFQSSAKTLVNTVNCVGIMGKGIAQEFKKKYPDMFQQYKHECEQGKILPGVPRYYADLFGHSVINFPTKKHWKSPSLLKDIENGLDTFVAKYKEWGIESVAFPPLGCGNGGLSWDAVGPLMYQKLSRVDIPVEIYAPFGTPAEKLTREFLMDTNKARQTKGVLVHQKITPENFIALEVLYRLGKQKYVKPVGRTIFQKICYILNERSVNTGLTFTKGTYGPYSKDLERVLHAFANANLTQETEVPAQKGKMMRLEVGSAFEKYQREFSEEIKKYEPAIAMTVDLFSRIKNTNQAEEAATVIYSVKILKQEEKNVSEQKVLNYLIEWKKTWNEEEKKHSIIETLRNLQALGWISVEYSPELSRA